MESELKFKLFKKDKLFYFHLLFKNKVILSSYSYTQKTNCLNGIKSVIRNSKNEDRFKVSSWGDSSRVDITAGNGRIVASSHMYPTDNAAKNAILQLMNLSFAIKINDLTKR